ncbi:MAG: hypothetical protein J0L82_10845 [Deltaproteobacteria bacterium]|nr:hypothetical protein [Deltaproteobacteria bacterium]
MDLKHAPLLNRLAAATGRYEGRGINHLGEQFKGELAIHASLDSQLVELKFRATDDDQAFHEESTWVTEDLLVGGLGLWTVSSNTPGVLPHRLIEDLADGSYSTKAVFRLGEPDDESRFRQEIALCVRHDGAIEYSYAWGVPHEAFASRSKCLLHASPAENQAAPQRPFDN